MMKWFLRRRIAAFEREWHYDTSYLHDLIEADPRAMMLFGKAIALGRYRKDAPPVACFAAGFVGVRSEDCGPSAQLSDDMALSAGMDPAVVRAVVAHDLAAMPDDAALAVRFAEATLRHGIEADELRDEIVRRWGRRGLVSLAFAITASRLYPTLKYALGHGRACTRVTVEGEPCAMPQPAAQAA